MGSCCISTQGAQLVFCDDREPDMGREGRLKREGDICKYIDLLLLHRNWPNCKSNYTPIFRMLMIKKCEHVSTKNSDRAQQTG